MCTIFTKYRGPRGSKGSSILATVYFNGTKHSFSQEVDNACSLEQNHRNLAEHAARSLKAFGQYTLGEGPTPESRVWVRTHRFTYAHADSDTSSRVTESHVFVYNAPEFRRVWRGSHAPK